MDDDDDDDDDGDNDDDVRLMDDDIVCRDYLKSLHKGDIPRHLNCFVPGNNHEWINGDMIWSNSVFISLVHILTLYTMVYLYLSWVSHS